jgi:hypothetical protein
LFILLFLLILHHHQLTKEWAIRHHPKECHLPVEMFSLHVGPTVTYPALSPPHLALSVSLALALLLILAFQFWPFSASLNGVKPFFTEIRLKMDGEEFSIFGRKLEMSTGDYFLDIPYARANRFQAILC